MTTPPPAGSAMDNWEQMLAAIQALDSGASLCMRKPGDWYVDARMEVGGDGFLTSLYGNGNTPEEAVRETWREIISLPIDRHLHCRGQRVRWSGFMWSPVTLPASRPSREAEGKPL